MSAHNSRSRSQATPPTKFRRESFPLAHVQIELIEHPTDGITFGLRTKEGPENRPCLCSGFVEKGMATSLRRLAHRLDELEGKL